MNNEEKILVLLEQHSEMFAQINSRLDKMDERLNQMDSRLDKMDERLDRMEEYAEITRDGVNALLDWAEACSETYSLFTTIQGASAQRLLFIYTKIHFKKGRDT